MSHLYLYKCFRRRAADETVHCGFLRRRRRYRYIGFQLVKRCPSTLSFVPG